MGLVQTVFTSAKEHASKISLETTASPSKPQESSVTRRNLLKGLGAVGGSSILSACAGIPSPEQGESNDSNSSTNPNITLELDQDSIEHLIDEETVRKGETTSKQLSGKVKETKTSGDVEDGNLEEFVNQFEVEVKNSQKTEQDPQLQKPETILTDGGVEVDSNHYKNRSEQPTILELTAHHSQKDLKDTASITLEKQHPNTFNADRTRVKQNGQTQNTNPDGFQTPNHVFDNVILNETQYQEDRSAYSRDRGFQEVIDQILTEDGTLREGTHEFNPTQTKDSVQDYPWHIFSGPFEGAPNQWSSEWYNKIEEESELLKEHGVNPRETKIQAIGTAAKQHQNVTGDAAPSVDADKYGLTIQEVYNELEEDQIYSSWLDVRRWEEGGSHGMMIHYLQEEDRFVQHETISDLIAPVEDSGLRAGNNSKLWIPTDYDDQSTWGSWDQSRINEKADAILGRFVTTKDEFNTEKYFTDQEYRSLAMDTIANKDNNVDATEMIRELQEWERAAHQHEGYVGLHGEPGDAEILVTDDEEIKNRARNHEITAEEMSELATNFSVEAS